MTLCRHIRQLRRFTTLSAWDPTKRRAVPLAEVRSVTRTIPTVATIVGVLFLSPHAVSVLLEDGVSRILLLNAIETLTLSIAEFLNDWCAIVVALVSVFVGAFAVVVAMAGDAFDKPMTSPKVVMKALPSEQQRAGREEYFSLTYRSYLAKLFAFLIYSSVVSVTLFAVSATILSCTSIYMQDKEWASPSAVRILVLFSPMLAQIPSFFHASRAVVGMVYGVGKLAFEVPFGDERLNLTPERDEDIEAVVNNDTPS